MTDFNYTVFRGSMQRGADDEGLLLSRVQGKQRGADDDGF